MSIDRALFHWINGWPDWLAPVFVFFSEVTDWDWGRALVLGLLLALGFYRPTRAPTFLALPAVLLANEFTEMFKYGLKLTRPSAEAAAQVSQLRLEGLTKEEALARLDSTVNFHGLEPLSSYGSASSHAGNMMAVAVVYLLLARPFGYGWLVVALLTGLSRIYVGVHWPYQIIFGWICGALIGFMVAGAWKAWLRIRKDRLQHRLDESQPLEN